MKALDINSCSRGFSWYSQTHAFFKTLQNINFGVIIGKLTHNYMQSYPTKF